MSNNMGGVQNLLKDLDASCPNHTFTEPLFFLPNDVQKSGAFKLATDKKPFVKGSTFRRQNSSNSASAGGGFRQPRGHGVEADGRALRREAGGAERAAGGAQAAEAPGAFHLPGVRRGESGRNPREGFLVPRWPGRFV